MKLKSNNIKSLMSIAALVLPLAAISGCASIVTGLNQSVSVDTPPIKGANCSLTNDKGQWFVSSTPGSVMVHKSYKELNVNCKKEGYPNGQTRVESKTKPMVFGNALVGGAIGASIDIADGAAYDYPTNITVPMSKGRRG